MPPLLRRLLSMPQAEPSSIPCQFTTVESAALNRSIRKAKAAATRATLQKRQAKEQAAPAAPHLSPLAEEEEGVDELEEVREDGANDLNHACEDPNDETLCDGDGNSSLGHGDDADGDDAGSDHGEYFDGDNSDAMSHNNQRTFTASEVADLTRWCADSNQRILAVCVLLRAEVESIQEDMERARRYL
eukprot:4553342-Pleurochrysis_carterae.AAC.1